jgi:small subunit ribosomal protein S3
MATEKKFLQKAINDFEVKAFLENKLERAGVSSVTIQRTPIATRITLEVQKPGIVVGKRGTAIDELAADLKQFGIDNPQIEVIEVAVPALDSKLIAHRIAKSIELRGNVKQSMRIALREIMAAGALGAEIRVSGKIVGKGGKAKTITVRSGFLKKSGELMKLVRKAAFTTYPKAGAIGIRVKILPPGTKLPDKIQLPPEAKPAVVQAPAEPVAPEAPAVEEKPSAA